MHRRRVTNKLGGVQASVVAVALDRVATSVQLGQPLLITRSVTHDEKLSEVWPSWLTGSF